MSRPRRRREGISETSDMLGSGRMRVVGRGWAGVATKGEMGDDGGRGARRTRRRQLKEEQAY